MLTFLELYQTLLGFVFFKLYTDLGLVYPPPLDASKDEAAAGVGAYSLQEVQKDQPVTNGAHKAVADATGKKISGKDVRKTIKSIQAGEGDAMETDAPAAEEISQPETVEDDEDFVAQPSKTDATVTELPTLKTLVQQAPSINTQLFTPYTFFLSRETPRPLMEFVIRAFGGRVGWTVSQGGGSPYDEDDESITHVIIDRPVHVPAPPQGSSTTEPVTVEETEKARSLRLKRKYVQPQWVMDCINKGKILLEGPYERGKTLPPHLSPFGEESGAYEPEESEVAKDAEEVEDSEEEVEEVEGVDVDIADADAQDPEALRAAELAAEAAGMDYGTFEKALQKKQKKAARAEPAQRSVNQCVFAMFVAHVILK